MNDNTKRVEQLLRQNPMTRAELERATGLAQQRVSEAISGLAGRVHVVGYQQPAWKGRPAPVYSLEQREESTSFRIGRVSSVFDLGACHE